MSKTDKMREEQIQIVGQQNYTPLAEPMLKEKQGLAPNYRSTPR